MMKFKEILSRLALSPCARHVHDESGACLTCAGLTD